VKWYWQGKTEILGEKYFPVPSYPPLVWHELTQDRARTSAIRSWQLTAWVMARPVWRLKWLYIINIQLAPHRDHSLLQYKD
jgi:hypothetical protein